jgi:hypothetical protein
MRRLLPNAYPWVLVVLFGAACTTAPAPDSSAAMSAQVLPADARALAYGRTLGEVTQNPGLRDKIPQLFGADWMPAAPGRGQIASGAEPFLEKGGPLRMVKVEGKDYVAVTGCATSACSTRRVLLLIGEGGSPLVARVDDGPTPRYYAFGGGGVAPPANAPGIVDAALRALRDAGSVYP